MIEAQETKKLLKEFAWECYEFHANDLGTNDDTLVWPKVLMDLEGVIHDPFSPQGDLLDVEAKTEFVRELKMDLGI